MALLLFLIASALGFSGPCGAGSEPAEQTPPIPSVTIRNRNVTLEVARTRAEQSRGLGYRDSLEWGHGMLFPYEKAHFPGFWMKGMRFDIDIVWIREGRIVDISHRVPHSPEGPGPTVRPAELTDTVLEVPAGFAQAHGWRRDDRVTFHLEKSD